MGKSSIDGLFSMAVLNNQRVSHRRLGNDFPIKTMVPGETSEVVVIFPAY